MSRISSWHEFKPSLLLLALGQVRELTEAAYKKAANAAELAIPGTSGGAPVMVEGVLQPTEAGKAADPNRWLNFGHVPDPGPNKSLSNSTSYRLEIWFNASDEVDRVKLTIFLANPRLSVSLGDFLPAQYVQADARIHVLSESGGRLGLAMLAGSGEAGSEEDTFAKLSADLPAGSEVAPDGFHRHSKETLLGRIDLTCEWRKSAKDALGFWPGVPGGRVPEGLPLMRLAVFSSVIDGAVSAVVHKSRKIAVRLLEGPLKSSLLILSDIKNPGDAGSPEGWRLYRRTLQEFSLNGGFKGFVFQGLAAHWIEDDLHVSSCDVELDTAAIAFSGAALKDGKEEVTFHFSLLVRVGNRSSAPDAEKPFLGWFAPRASLRVSNGTNGLRYLTLQGQFTDLTKPFEFLSQKNFSLSGARYKWKDNVGAEHDDWSFEISLEKTDDRYLARIDVEGDATLSAAIVALSFAPIVFMRPAAPDTNVPAPDAKTRGYFVEVASAESILAVFAAAKFGAFLKDYIFVKELRVTDAHFRIQPAGVNNTRAGKELETALLFDYDVDYGVKIKEADLETERNVSSHVDGTGFVLANKYAKWVQVPTGAYELGLADPGLWSLTGLGKILKISDIRIRRTDHVYLVVRLRLAQNFASIKCDDFVIAVDLTDKLKVSIEAYPSEVEVNIAKVFKGSGLLRITKTNNERDITGALDLAFLSVGWRLFAGLRITHVTDHEDVRHTALVATVEVDWPRPIPIASTGLGLSGLAFLYATHFARKEKSKVGAIPPALQWLKEADGDVVTSIKKPQKKVLWAADYGRWSAGIGMQAGLIVNDRLVNLNGLLTYQLPGPKIIAFVKASLIARKERNEDTDLTAGILGILEFNWEEETITLGALAEMSFKELLKINVPIELFASMRSLSHWHAYLGHYKTPISIDLKIFSVFRAGVSGFLMFDGNEITGLPRRSGPVRLPGLAIAFGMRTAVRFGTDSLYLEVSFETYVDLALSNILYAGGGAVLGGTLHLWIVDIGASGWFDFKFLRGADGGTTYTLSGKICGHVKLFHKKIEGCIGVSLGPGVQDVSRLDDLIEGVLLLAGSQAVLHGQGAFNPIDAVIGKAVPEDAGPPPPTSDYGLDSILSIGMRVPPTVARPPQNPGKTEGGFAPFLPQPVVNTVFQFGSRKGQYIVTEVKLQSKTDGTWKDVRYDPSLPDHTPARWWRNPGKSEGGHPAPISLALMTRNPLIFNEALLMPGFPGGYLGSILKGICDDPPPVENAIYFFSPSLQACLDNQICLVHGTLRNTSVESAPGYSGITDLMLTIETVVPNRPTLIGAESLARTLPDVINGVAIPGIALHSFSEHGENYIAPIVSLSTLGFWRQRSIEVCLAVPDSYRETTIQEMFALYTDGVLTPVPITVRQLPGPSLVDFHQNEQLWQPSSSIFARVMELTQFANFKAVLVSLYTADLAKDPSELRITLNQYEGRASGAETVVLGPVKTTPSAEHERYEKSVVDKKALRDELNNYIAGQDVPLLEPASEYAVTVSYDRKADNLPPETTTARYHFRTASVPPRFLEPYLLATYPSGSSARTMPLADKPAVLLSSHDILRILEKFGARIRVRISHTAGVAVKDSTGTIDWTNGAVFSPAEIRSDHPPKGIKVVRSRTWPSAMLRPILEAIENGKLPCLQPASGNGALWIGFDVTLLPLSTYHFRMEVLAPDDHPFPAPPDESQDAKRPFYENSFKTGLYKSLADLAGLLRNARPTRRMVSGLPSFGTSSNDPRFPGIEFVSDKVLEDGLMSSMGERQTYRGNPQITVLWQADGSVVKPVALALRNNEPIFLETFLPELGAVPGFDGSPSPTLLRAKEQAVWGPELSQSSGIQRLVVARSGLAAVVLLKADAQQTGVDLKVQRKWSWEWKPGESLPPGSSAVSFASSDLKSRDLHMRIETLGIA